MTETLESGSIITCSSCGEHLYKVKRVLIAGLDGLEAEDFEPINSMPIPITHQPTDPCNNCGANWIDGRLGHRIHTENGWWPKEQNKETI